MQKNNKKNFFNIIKQIYYQKRDLFLTVLWVFESLLFFVVFFLDWVFNRPEFNYFWFFWMLKILIFGFLFFTLGFFSFYYIKEEIFPYVRYKIGRFLDFFSNRVKNNRFVIAGVGFLKKLRSVTLLKSGKDLQVLFLSYNKFSKVKDCFLINNIFEVKTLISKYFYHNNVPFWFFPKFLYFSTLTEPKMVGFIIKMYDSIAEPQGKTFFKYLLYNIFYFHGYARLDYLFKLLENPKFKEQLSIFFSNLVNHNKRLGFQGLLGINLLQYKDNFQVRFRYYFYPGSEKKRLKYLVIMFEKELMPTSETTLLLQKHFFSFTTANSHILETRFGFIEDCQFFKKRGLDLEQCEYLERVGFFCNLEHAHVSEGRGCLFSDKENRLALGTSLVLRRVFFDSNFKIKSIVFCYKYGNIPVFDSDMYYFYSGVSFLKEKQTS